MSALFKPTSRDTMHKNSLRRSTLSIAIALALGAGLAACGVSDYRDNATAPVAPV